MGFWAHLLDVTQTKAVAPDLDLQSPTAGPAPTLMAVVACLLQGTHIMTVPVLLTGPQWFGHARLAPCDAPRIAVPAEQAWPHLSSGMNPGCDHITSVSSALTLWWPGSGLLRSGIVFKSSSAALSSHLLMAVAYTYLGTEGLEGGTAIGPWMGLYKTILLLQLSQSRGFHLMTLLMGAQTLSLWIWSYPVCLWAGQWGSICERHCSNPSLHSHPLLPLAHLAQSGDSQISLDRKSTKLFVLMWCASVQAKPCHEPQQWDRPLSHCL